MKCLLVRAELYLEGFDCRCALKKPENTAGSVGEVPNRMTDCVRDQISNSNSRIDW